MVSTRTLLVALTLALAACGGDRESSTVVTPVADTAGAETVAPPPPVGPPESYVGAHHRVVARIDMEAVRRSSLSADIGSMVRSYPTWQQLLGSSGIDPVRDFDAVLVAAPGVIADQSTLFIRHHLGSAHIREAVLGMAVDRSERSSWREVDGFPVVDWPADTRVPRVVVLTAENELVVTTPDELERVLAVARDHAARREGDAVVEPALVLEPGLIATVAAEEVGEGGQRMRFPPDAFQVTVREDPEQPNGILLIAHGTYADADAAAQARSYYSERRDFYAGQMLVRAVGLDRPLRAATIAGEGNIVDVSAAISEEELRRMLGLLSLGQLAGN